jgi:hypothetical protein
LAPLPLAGVSSVSKTYTGSDGGRVVIFKENSEVALLGGGGGGGAEVPIFGY